MGDTWVVPTLAKNSLDAIIILSQLVEAGLMTGACSANDIKHDPANPNTKGSVFKIIRNVGFVKTSETLKATGKKRHSGTIFKWTLREHYKAMQFSDRCRNRLLELGPPKQQEQGVLPL
jgi:hypothetical protein